MSKFNTSFIKSRYLGGPTTERIEPGAFGAVLDKKKQKKKSFKVVLGEEFLANGRGSHKIIFNDPTDKRSIVQNSQGEMYLINDDKMQEAINSGSLQGARAMPKGYSEYFMRNIPGGKRYDPEAADTATQYIDLKDRDLSDNALKAFKSGGTASYQKGKKLKARPIAAVKYTTKPVPSADPADKNKPKPKSRLIPRKAKKAGGKMISKAYGKGGGGCGCGGKV